MHVLISEDMWWNFRLPRLSGAYHPTANFGDRYPGNLIFKFNYRDLFHDRTSLDFVFHH